jgi:hypothetical protein
LFIASQRGHVDAVGLLLDDLRATDKFSSGVNAADAAGATPLFAACQNGHDEVVKLLLASRGNVESVEVDKVNNDGATPVCSCPWRGRPRLAWRAAVWRLNERVLCCFPERPPASPRAAVHRG